MPKFTDTTSIRIKAGDGGRGAVSFHREKFVPKGGPDGGDGGRGGDVYIQADFGLYNLSHLFKNRLYRAENGSAGSGNNKHGCDGNDLTIRVPPGTQVTDAESGDIITDLVDDAARCRIATGGIGGKGNAFFKSSTHQTPRFSQPGMPGDEKKVTLNLKLIADIGLVGLPNAGKSTVLSRITNAKPRIADYPFTTLVPNLGVIQRDDGGMYRIADIPGIIEGAHRGHGLGLSFLQHIERVKIILFIIDVTEQDLRYNLSLLRSELDTYNQELTAKPYYIILNKIDLLDRSALYCKIESLKDPKVLAVSALTGKNINSIVEILGRMMEHEGAPQKPD